MYRRDNLGRAKHYVSDLAIYAAPLKATQLPIGQTSEACRVCGRDIAVDDHCLHRPRYAGHACITCGFWTLAEVESDYLGAPFRRLMAALEKRQIGDSYDTALLVQMGIVRRHDDDSNRIGWTDCGRRLAAEWRARHQQEKTA